MTAQLDFYSELMARGIIETSSLTDESKLKELLNNEKISFFISKGALSNSFSTCFRITISINNIYQIRYN